MKKKISAVLAVSMIATNISPAINVYANEVVKDKARIIEENVVSQAKITSFKLSNYSNFEDYNAKFRVPKEGIKKISNNGGKYDSSSIEKAIDGNLSTHWETGKENSADFKNEVVIEFNDVESINRIAYATRQDGAKGKGYPTKFEIYSSITGNDEDFKLVSTGEHSSTGNMMEFKFDTITTKKVKFVFKEAYNNWASASEFWFYKEDKVLDSMEKLFTDESMNKVSEEFATEEKLNELEKQVKEHPFSDNLVEDIANAKKLLENNAVEYADAKVSKLLGYGTKYQEAYDKEFRLDQKHIIKTEANGGTYYDSEIDYMYDGNTETHWESNKYNDANFKNEVVFTFDEIQTLDRIALLPRSGNQKGFPTSFEIYASETSKGDAFKLVSKGTATVTKDYMQFKFNPTKFKRLKFVFKECNSGKPFISEARFYKQDAVSEKIPNIFANEKRTELSKEFNNIEVINTLEEQAKTHPLYEEFKEDLNDAKLLLSDNSVEYVDANVFKFRNFNDEKLAEYNKDYKIDNSRIKISTNGRHWSNQVIENAIDGDINTNWHSDAKNNNNHTNEVVMTLDKIETIDKVVYTTNRDRGFAKQFDIYVSKTLSGDTFTKVTSGSSAITTDSVAIEFNPTEARRVKFVFRDGHEGWAIASEFGIYKADDAMRSVHRLFTDNTITQVTDEFNSVEAINALEDKCKQHPLYEDFKEDLENARALVEQKEVEATKAETKKFNHLNNKAYLEEFRMSYDNIKSIKTNGNNYGSQVIEHAIDGNLETYWETGKLNGDNFKNEVTVEFKEAITIDRIAFAARQSDRKGFAEQFEIYGSNTTKGDDFHLVSTGYAGVTEGLVEAKFGSTTFKRLKLKWIAGSQNSATLSEIMFFSEDEVAEKVSNLFSNGLRNELNPEYNTLDAIEELEKEVSKHPLKDELMEDINDAKDLLKNPDKNQGKIIELDFRGDSVKESQKRKIWNFQDPQPTSLAVKSGEKITVYVDAEPGAPLPKLTFKQMDSRHNGQKTINLNRGKNEITIPEVEVNDLRPGVAKAGVLYTSNPYTEAEQIRKPKIRIEGGFSYPHFIKGVDNDEEVMQELRDYVAKLKEDSSLPDVFEVFSDKTLVNVKATYALKWYTDNNKLPSYTADKSDKVMAEAMKFWGFDNSKDVHSDFNYRYISMVKNVSGGLMNAGSGITGFGLGDQGGALNGDTSWGFMHELGHNLDTGNRSIVEVTNNILPLHFQMINGQASRITQQNLWENRIFPNVAKEDYSKNEWYPDNDKSLLTHIAPLWQLQIYDNNFWPRFEQQFRERNIGGGDWNKRHEAWAVVASDVLQLDLTEHFARHGFYVNDETKEHMSQYEKPSKKLWYINDNKYLKQNREFNDNVNYEVKTTVQEDSVKLDFTMDKVNSESLIGYEIFRDGNLIGFTAKDSFVDSGATKDTNHEYKVVAYDAQLNPSEGVTVKAYQPNIDVVEGVTLKLKEEFKPEEFAKAYTAEGKALDNIEIVNTVDNTKTGDYTVTYKVTDRGITVSKTMNVSVVGTYDYLSDLDYETAKTEYDIVRFNESIKGRTLGEIKDYDKGIRVHANGKVVYDLGEHNYDYLELRVGVDMNVKQQKDSSVTFKVVGDDKTLATTKVLRYEDDLEYIKVPVKDVKKLTIEVNDGGNNITSDRGIIVEPKLTTNDAKPQINIPKSQTVKVGGTLENLVGEFTATDLEDGNLTNQVKVTGQDKVNLNRVGSYPITYTVTDKDGHTTVKSRVINVINTEDSKYVSDSDWVSATAGWGTVRKDKSLDNRVISLTGKDGNAVTYEKGIGTHAYSEILYDLTDKDVTLFSSYIGVDREVYKSWVSTIEFKIYVDGELAYESGVMNDRDPQKYVEVDLAGAKQLKLVVTEGGNGNGSDHGDWADAKFYYVNKDRVDTADLTKAVEDAKKIDKENYTDESIEVLEEKLAKAEEVLKAEKPNQEEVDNATTELQESLDALVAIDLTEVVNIPDEYLAKALRQALNKDGNLTIGDMRILEHLDVGYGVASLEGLQYAKNLKTITGEANEIKDLRPLSKLKNLTEVNFGNQYVAVGELNIVDGNLKVNTEAYNRAGKNVVTKVRLVNKAGEVVKEQDLDGTAKEVDLDVRDMQSGFYGVHVTFEDTELSGTLLYMVRI